MYLREELATKPRPAWEQVLRLALASGRNRIRRGASRSLQAVYGVYAWLALAVVMLPGWLVTVVLPAPIDGHPARKTLRLLCRTALVLAGLKPRISGEEFLAEAARRSQEGQPLLLVSNHASYLDVLVVAAVSPAPICFVSKSEAASWPIVGTFIRKCGYLTVSRRDASHAAADSEGMVGKLQLGESVHVFPEGTFTRQNGLRPFQMGAFKSAVESGCPILPMTLVGTRNVLRDGAWLPRHAKLSVVASPDIKPRGEAGEIWSSCATRFRSEILKHCGEGAFDAVLAGAPKPGADIPNVSA